MKEELKIKKFLKTNRLECAYCEHRRISLCGESIAQNCKGIDNYYSINFCSRFERSEKCKTIYDEVVKCK
jgi:hypothetical protein